MQGTSSGIQVMRQQAAPSLTLSFDELMVMGMILRGAIDHLVETQQPGHARRTQIRALVALHRRFMSLPPCATGLAFLLSAEEISLLDSAIVGFCAFARDHVPASVMESEETLQSLQRMHETLVQLLA